MLKKVYNFVPDNAMSNEQTIYKTMKIFWKNLSVAIAAVSLISACSDSNNSSIPTPAIPKRGVTRNIEEKTQYASYIDWQTYAGDDFYRYATGRTPPIWATADRKARSKSRTTRRMSSPRKPVKADVPSSKGSSRNTKARKTTTPTERR